MCSVLSALSLVSEHHLLASITHNISMPLPLAKYKHIDYTIYKNPIDNRTALNILHKKSWEKRNKLFAMYMCSLVVHRKLPIIILHITYRSPSKPSATWFFSIISLCGPGPSFKSRIIIHPISFSNILRTPNTLL